LWRNLCVVCCGKVGIAAFACFAVIADSQIISTKCWSIAIATENKRGITDSHHFLLEIELQQKCFSFGIIYIIAIADLIPFVFGKTTDGFSLICLHNGQRVFHIIAILMELGSLKLMRRRPEQ
jgi:hypothetical protein